MHSQNASRSWENPSGSLFWTVVLDFTIRCGLFWSVCATEIVILTSVEHRHGCMNWVNAQINVHGKYLIKNGPRSSETTLLPESHQSPPAVHSGLPSVARGYGQPPVCKASPALCSHQCAKPPPLCAATSVQGPVFVFPKLCFSPSCWLTRLFVHSVYTHLLKARYGTVDGDTLSPSLRLSHWLLDHPADWIRFPPSSPLPWWQDLSLSLRQPDVRVIRLTKSLLNWNSLSPHIFISPFPHV